MTIVFLAQSYEPSVRFRVNTEDLLSTIPTPVLPTTTEGLLAIILRSVSAEEVLMKYSAYLLVVFYPLYSVLFKLHVRIKCENGRPLWRIKLRPL